MADLIVDLPCHDALLILIVLDQFTDDFFRIRIHVRTVEAVNVSSAEGSLLSAFEFREDVRMLFCQPCRNRRGRGSHNHLQVPLFCFFDDTVKEREIVLSFLFLHQMPGKFRNSDHVASQLHNCIKILLKQGCIPLLRIVIYTKPHSRSSTFLLKFLYCFFKPSFGFFSVFSDYNGSKFHPLCQRYFTKTFTIFPS